MENTLNFFNKHTAIALTHHWLPHWQQGSVPCFVTWHLADSIPVEKLNVFKYEKHCWLEAHPKPWTEHEENDYYDRFSGKIDHYLDAGIGDCILKYKKNAELLAAALRYGDQKQYRLFAFVIMPNHVHVLFQCLGDNSISDIIGEWKSVSSHKINRANQRRGKLWQNDFWDTLIRSEKHFNHCVRYIVENPKPIPSGEYMLFMGDDFLSRPGADALLDESMSKAE